MRKILNKNHLLGRSTSRTLVAFAVAGSLAAFGCTTNRTPGEGNPRSEGPWLRPSPSSTVSNSPTSIIVTPSPMMSSSTYVEPLPTVNARTSGLPLSAGEAAAVMADQQAVRGKVLGVVNPGPGSAQVSIAGNQVTGPAPVSSRPTLNSTIYGPGTGAAITSGASGEPPPAGVLGFTPTGVPVLPVTAISGGVVAVGTGTGTGMAVSTSTPATPLSATTGQIPTTTSTTGATPTVAASGVSPTTVAGTSVSPTVVTATSAGPVTAAATSVPTPVGATTPAAPATPTATTPALRSTDVAASATVNAGVGSATVASPVRVTNANGKVVVTNGPK